MTKDDVQGWSTEAKALPPKHPLRYLLINLGVSAGSGGVVSVEECDFNLWEKEMGIDAEVAVSRILKAEEIGWLRVERRRGLSMSLQLLT